MDSFTDGLLQKAAAHMVSMDPSIDYYEAMKRVSKVSGVPATSKETHDLEYSAKRIKWDSYFMSIAFVTAMRSQDSETQHGCLIVDKNNRIIATGYNGFLSGTPDEDTPNKRPLKYAHIVHSEINAIISAKQDLTDCKVYVTGLPCNECLKVMAQSGIREIVVGDRPHVFAEGYLEMQSIICASQNIKIRKFKGHLAHLDGRKIE